MLHSLGIHSQGLELKTLPHDK